MESVAICVISINTRVIPKGRRYLGTCAGRRCRLKIRSNPDKYCPDLPVLICASLGERNMAASAAFDHTHFPSAPAPAHSPSEGLTLPTCIYTPFFPFLTSPSPFPGAHLHLPLLDHLPDCQHHLGGLLPHHLAGRHIKGVILRGGGRRRGRARGSERRGQGRARRGRAGRTIDCTPHGRGHKRRRIADGMMHHAVRAWGGEEPTLALTATTCWSPLDPPLNVSRSFGSWGGISAPWP